MPGNSRLPTQALPTAGSATAGAFIGYVPDDAFGHDALTLAEQSAGIGVWSIDLVSGMVRATAQFFRTMGLEPSDGRVSMDAIRALRHPDDRDRVVDGFRHALAGGVDSYEVEYRIIRPDGQLRWIFGRGRVVRDDAGRPVRYSGVDLDITDRKTAEAALARAKEELEHLNQILEARVRERTSALESEAKLRAEAESRLQQAQKMEAVGQLTGGIAHDFNNMLQVIMGNLEIARLWLQRPDPDGRLRTEPIVKSIEAAQRGSRSAANVVQRLLAFARQQRLEPTLLDVNRLISGMADMIERTLGATIRVERQLHADLWTTCADRNQLESTLLNLVVNARDAMPDGGRLTVSTANAEIGTSPQGDIPAGQYVMVSVADTGCGIPTEVLDKVFDPFFTTKDVGMGSGLGLSMVYGFVKQSRGHVRIHSEVGAGSTVRIYLPRALHGDASGAAKPEEQSTVTGGIARAVPGETLLVVEDNADVRRFASAALQNIGYRVLQAEDGAAALRMLDALGDARLDLLFTDFVLPGGMNGAALAQAVALRRPNLPVLYTSGYTSNSSWQRGELAADVRMLAKPYTLETLANRVRNAIDAPALVAPPAHDGELI
jgi:PAS domain S-box-containing protein